MLKINQIFIQNIAKEHIIGALEFLGQTTSILY